MAVSGVKGEKQPAGNATIPTNCEWCHADYYRGSDWVQCVCPYCGKKNSR